MRRTFGQTLKKLRTAWGLTQFQLATKLNLSRNQINSHENELTEPDLKALDSYATFFNVSVDTLLGRHVTTDDEILKHALDEIQKINAALDESQREQFCKQVYLYVKFLDEHNEIL
jgi:transcriptional regulator with XRE-family HTH domain